MLLIYDLIGHLTYDIYYVAIADESFNIAIAILSIIFLKPLVKREPSLYQASSSTVGEFSCWAGVNHRMINDCYPSRQNRLGLVLLLPSAALVVRFQIFPLYKVEFLVNFFT